MKETLIDIETYCETDIKKCGLYRYVSDPSFEILLIAWATDEGSGFGETRLVDLASGEPFPQELLDDFKDSKVTLIAHNAAFERVSFSRYLQQQYPGQYLEPGAFLSPDRWICTMVMAASLIRQDCGRMIVYHSRLIYFPSDGNIQSHRRGEAPRKTKHTEDTDHDEESQNLPCQHSGGCHRARADRH